MEINLGEDKHLVVNMGKGVMQQQVIIDYEAGDIRITDYQHVVKIRLTDLGKRLRDILVDDVFVHTFTEESDWKLKK